MTNLERIEIARKLLINAAEMNFSKETLLKISQLIDKYHVNYLKEEVVIKKYWQKRDNPNSLKVMEVAVQVFKKFHA